MTLLFGMPGGLEWVLIIGVFGTLLILPILAIADIVRSEFKNANDKLIWILIVLFMPFFGSLIYFLVGRGQKVSA